MAFPLDVEPAADGKRVARSVEPLTDQGLHRYRSHFASCEQAAEFRKPRNGAKRPGKARA